MAALDLQGLNRRMKLMSKIFDGFLERIIDDHLQKKEEEEKKKKNRDFVDIMLAVMKAGEAEFEFDRRHVKDMFIGATDTSASAVAWAISELIKHPEVTKKLQNELEQVVGMDQTVDVLNFANLEEGEEIKYNS